MPEPTWTRETLIALNTCADISRDSICALASAPFSMLDDPSGIDRSVGRPRPRPIRPRTVRTARVVLDHAAATAAAESARAHAFGASILTLVEPGYPRALMDLELPPPVLYLLGRLPDRPAIAVVGSRRADVAGLEAAELFGRELARGGAAVVSGLARGVDTAAHRGALQAPDGRTVGVLGCGLDVPYPRGRERLVREMADRGAVISEFPLGAPPLPHHFPIRNRLIAALALGTLVVQAAPRSGSLITARLALELGRDVYAVPGRIFDRRSLGTNSLIRDGALLVQRPRDILESLPLAVRDALARHHDGGDDEPHPAPPLDGSAGALLSHLEEGAPRTTDDLARLAGLDVESTLSGLLELELAGLVKRHPGPSFCLSTNR